MFACVVMNCDGTRARISFSTFPQRVLMPSASRTRADARVNRNIKPAATNHQLLKITARAPHCGPNRLRLSLPLTPTPALTTYFHATSTSLIPPHAARQTFAAPQIEIALGESARPPRLHLFAARRSPEIELCVF